MKRLSCSAAWQQSDRAARFPDRPAAHTLTHPPLPSLCVLQAPPELTAMAMPRRSAALAVCLLALAAGAAAQSCTAGAWAWLD